MEREKKMAMNLYRTHIAKLSHDHQVAVLQDPNMTPDSGYALGQLGTIVVAPVIDETTYMVAMHELGHVLAPNGHGHIDAGLSPFKKVAALMDQEDAAWAWARANALVWTDLMEHWAQYSRETYRKAVVDICKATYIPRVKGKPISEWR